MASRVAMVSTMRFEHSPLPEDEPGESETFGTEMPKSEAWIAYYAFMGLADFLLDIWTGISFFLQGLFALGAFTLMIPSVAGLLCYTVNFFTWSRASFQENREHHYCNLDRYGNARPGLLDMVLSIFHIHEFALAWKSMQRGQDLQEWRRERAMLGVFEGLPSSILQTYAALSREGRVKTAWWQDAVLIMSVAFSLFSIAGALEIINTQIIPIVQIQMVPLWKKMGIRIWRLADVASRAWSFALFCFVTAQNQICPFAFIAIVVNCVVSVVFFWCSSQSATSRYTILSVACTMVGLPLLVLRAENPNWTNLMRWQAMHVLWRLFEMSLTIYLSAVCSEQFAVPSVHHFFLWLSFLFQIATLLATGAVAGDLLLRIGCGTGILPSMADSKPLLWASQFGSARLLRSALAKVQGEEDLMKAMVLAAAGGHYGCMNLLSNELQRFGPLTERPWPHSQTPLHLAAKFGQIHCLEPLVGVFGANVLDEEGNTALHFAAQSGQHLCIGELCDLGASVEKASHFGMSALHVASESGQSQCVARLLELRVDVEAACSSGKGYLDGTTGMHFAAKGHKDIIRLLHEHDADVNATNSFGTTPMHWAARDGHLDCLKLLKDLGAWQRPNFKGVTPSDFASEKGHQDCLLFLEGQNTRTQRFCWCCDRGLLRLLNQ
eukprot:Skav230481  [mRNA]  locus=scaffold1445:308943:310934:- [translate_table: standard]